MVEENKPTSSQNSVKQGESEPVPISKSCSGCGETKLLSEFKIDESKNDRLGDICKFCQAHAHEIFGTCCETHFNEVLVANTFTQLANLLEVLDVIRQNEIEIPKELLKKMFEITHLVNVRCKYDLCARDGTLSSQFEE